MSSNKETGLESLSSPLASPFEEIEEIIESSSSDTEGIQSLNLINSDKEEEDDISAEGIELESSITIDEYVELDKENSSSWQREKNNLEENISLFFYQLFLVLNENTPTDFNAKKIQQVSIASRKIEELLINVYSANQKLKDSYKLSPELSDITLSDLSNVNNLNFAYWNIQNCKINMDVSGGSANIWLGTRLYNVEFLNKSYYLLADLAKCKSLNQVIFRNADGYIDFGVVGPSLNSSLQISLLKLYMKKFQLEKKLNDLKKKLDALENKNIDLTNIDLANRNSSSNSLKRKCSLISDEQLIPKTDIPKFKLPLSNRSVFYSISHTQLVDLTENYCNSVTKKPKDEITEKLKKDVELRVINIAFQIFETIKQMSKGGEVAVRNLKPLNERLTEVLKLIFKTNDTLPSKFKLTPKLLLPGPIKIKRLRDSSSWVIENCTLIMTTENIPARILLGSIPNETKIHCEDFNGLLSVDYEANIDATPLTIKNIELKNEFKTQLFRLYREIHRLEDEVNSLCKQIEDLKKENILLNEKVKLSNQHNSLFKHKKVEGSEQKFDETNNSLSSDGPKPL